MVEAEIIEHVDLNSSRSDKETIHLELAFDGAAPAYKPGDSLDLYPENDPGLCRRVAQGGRACAGRHAARRIHQEPRRHHAVAQDGGDLCRNDRPSIRQGADRRRARRKDWIAGRQLIDLIEQFPIALDGRAAPRADASAGAARLLDRVVAPRGGRRGASSGLGRALRQPRPRPQGCRIELRRRAPQAGRPRARQGAAQQAFRPAGPRPRHHHGRPRHRRRAVPRLRAGAPRDASATGKSWLFFGDRSFTHDFLYQLEWQDALKDGALTRMDVAFSRDTPEKVYVQHRIWERRRELVEWLDNGALFLRLRRRQGDGEGRARDAGARLCRREGAVAGGRRAGGGDTRARASAICRTRIEHPSVIPGARERREPGIQYTET